MMEEEEIVSPLEHEPSLIKPDVSWYPQNLDWYVKWGATVLILFSMIFRAAGVEWRAWDLAFGTIGVILWLWVSVMWNDRALIILNAVSVLLLASTFLNEL